MTNLKIYTDGGSRGNPGNAGLGWIIFSENNLVDFEAKYHGIATNNNAEYSALEDVVKYISKNKSKHFSSLQKIDFYLDSELVVKQLTGVYKIKDQKLAEIALSIKSKLSKLDISFAFTHVPRNQNKFSDKLVNLALDNYLQNEKN